MQRAIHVFDNGVKVYDDHLIQVQRDRYAKRNVHEAEEEDVFVQIVQALPAEGCFVNIGSAIGYYPLLAKRLSPGITIHAVEPLARHRGFFIENIGLNGLNPKDFTLHKEAVFSSKGKAKFIDKDYGSSLFRAGTSKKPVKSQVAAVLKLFLSRLGLKTSEPISIIYTITLDDLVGMIGKQIDLLQMDVQGAEVEVLKAGPISLQAGHIKTFLIGTHGRRIHEECIGILKKYGYEIELDEFDTKEQPDGILVASIGVQRLKVH